MEQSKDKMWNLMVADCFAAYPAMQLGPSKSYSMNELKAQAENLGLLEDFNREL